MTQNSKFLQNGTSFEIYREGELIDMVGGEATSYDDDAGCVRTVRYEVAPISDDDDFLCPGMRLVCDLVNLDCDFASPLRINMGGPTAVDSQGRRWLGDPGAGADLWEIRPDDNGGANVIGDFIGGNLKPQSFIDLGLDPDHPGDIAIFNSIRWDPGADASVYQLEVPMGQGEYTVNLYFNEGCCPQRHAKISIEGELVAGDVSAWDFDPNADRAALPPIPALPGYLGKLTVEGVAAFDGVVSIELVGCPDCFEPVAATVDVNPILNALEIVRTGDVCPAEGDTFCESLVVEGPRSPSRAGSIPAI